MPAHDPHQQIANKMLTEDMPAPRTSQSQFESMRAPTSKKPQMLTEEELEEELGIESKKDAQRQPKQR